jgi:uncharacterized small protein (DUF1192 family)
MDWDEPKTKPGRTLTLGEDLSNLSILELEARIADFKAEIARAEAVMSAKKKHSAAADELFGKRT